MVVTDFFAVDAPISAEGRFIGILADTVCASGFCGWAFFGDTFSADAEEANGGIVFITDDGTIFEACLFAAIVAGTFIYTCIAIGVTSLSCVACFFGDDVIFADGKSFFAGAFGNESIALTL